MVYCLNSCELLFYTLAQHDITFLLRGKRLRKMLYRATRHIYVVYAFLFYINLV